MSKQKQLSYWLALTSCFLTGLAQAATLANEIEPNNSPSSAQTLITSGGATVNAAVGNNGTADPDQDYYSFYGTSGDLVTVNIDGTTNGLDTVIALYDNTSGAMIVNDDALYQDSGSTSIFDSLISNWVLPSTGYYTVLVCGSPCEPHSLGTVNMLTTASTGNYQLLITGASGSSSGSSGTSSGGSGTSSGGSADSPSAPAADVMQVAAESSPNQHHLAPINPKSHGSLPVLIYSGPNFNPLTIDSSSLTFGSNGDEHSLKKCNTQGVDKNRDGKADLLCLFNIQQANLDPNNENATLKGKLNDGTPFESTVFLKFLPEKH